MVPGRCDDAGLVLQGGDVLTMDAARPRAEALAVAGGRIVAVGARDEVLRRSPPGSVVEDLRGACVLPGLIDSHCHLESIGTALRDVDLYDVRSIEAIVEALRRRAEGAGPGAAVLGRGDCFHPSSLAEGRLPARGDLDRVAADRPVAVTDVDKTILNTYALEGLSPGPDAAPPPGGVVGRDARGRPDGVFYYAAKQMTPYGAQRASAARLSFAEGVLEGARAMAAAGFTCATIPAASREEIDAVRGLEAAGALAVRVVVMPRVGLLDEPGGLEGLACGDGSEAVRVGPLKLLYDSFVMHRTALMHEPYVGTPGGVGAARYAQARLVDIVRRAAAAGWPMAIHATGDRGLDEVLDAFERAGRRDFARPHQLIHAYLPTDGAFGRIAALGIPVAVQPPFLRAWGQTLRESLGEARAGRFYPLRRYLDAGIVLGGGSDAPIACHRPGLGIHAAVTRLTAAGRTLGAGQEISVGEALALYTRGAAAVLGDGGVAGTIRRGMRADLVVLARDPLRARGDDLLDLRVERTILGGRTTYRRGTCP